MLKYKFFYVFCFISLFIWICQFYLLWAGFIRLGILQELTISQGWDYLKSWFNWLAVLGICNFSSWSCSGVVCLGVWNLKRLVSRCLWITSTAYQIKRPNGCNRQKFFACCGFFVGGWGLWLGFLWDVGCCIIYITQILHISNVA